MSEPRDPTVPVLIAATIDCHDLEAMVAFWSGLLGVDGQIHEQFGFLSHAEGRKVTIWLQKVDDGFQGKNRLHLDLAVLDLEGALARVSDLGGSVGEEHTWQGFHWFTCSDPEGNVFDIMQATPADEPDSEEVEPT